LLRAAAVAWGPGEPLAMEEVEVAPPRRLEVRVKLLFTSICHTDLSFLKGEVCMMSASTCQWHDSLLDPLTNLYVFVCAAGHVDGLRLMLHKWTS